MPTGILNAGSVWGPFSETYLGVSRIMDEKSGARLDCALCIGRLDPPATVLPDNIFDYVQNVVTGERRAAVRAVPEKFSPNSRVYGLRYFIDAAGDTAAAGFDAASSSRLRANISFHNAGPVAREYFYSLGLILADDARRIRLKKALHGWWIPARAYASIQAYQKTFALGCRQCLSRVFRWGIEEQVLSQAFGGWPADEVCYEFALPGPLRDGYLYFRYIKYSPLRHGWEAKLNGRARRFEFPQTWAIPGGGWGKNRDARDEWRLLRLPLGKVAHSRIRLALRPIAPPGNDRARIWLDGMLFSDGLLPGDNGADATLPASLIDETIPRQTALRLLDHSGRRAVFEALLPDRAAIKMQIELDAPPGAVVSGTGSLLTAWRERRGLPVQVPERDAAADGWWMLDSRPISAPSGGARLIRFAISTQTPAKHPRLRRPLRRAARAPEPPRGPHAAMIAALRNIILYNINYPVNLFGRPSFYPVPAKYFSIPYSWDAGMAAVGLATFAPDLAVQFAGFFMADARHDFPMLYAGSPVPTPLYALWDCYQRTCDLSILRSGYRGARRMYEFYLGRTPGSAVHAGHGLLSTYAYNYNLGIDDHPIQRRAEELNLTHRGLYSIILTAQILRLARVMRNIAWLLGRHGDVRRFGADADMLAAAVENRMWDEASGLYGWLRRTGRGIERFALDGCRGDRSACAFLPLFAGQLRHASRLVAQIRDTRRFLTPYGVSSVDMQAPSFSPHGYWNGGIWPVMQWYVWRGLLECGETALARQVADSILNTWQASWQQEHYLGEHFMIAGGKMHGAPNFGGLNSTLLPMHAAYYMPYNATPVYDAVLLRKTINRARDELVLNFQAPFLNAAEHVLLVNMGRPRRAYRISLNGRTFGNPVAADAHGHLELRLPRSSQGEVLKIVPAGLEKHKT